jgi:hypothetical protein
MRLLLSLLGGFLPVILAITSPAYAQSDTGIIAVDVELIIAVDVSPSMDDEEFLLQRRGYAEAIAHPDFMAAVRAGKNGRIALTYVEWSAPQFQRVLVPWRVIEDETSAEAFAAELSGGPFRFWRGTSISAALTFGGTLFEENGYEGARRVIDISGDGPNNMGVPVVDARDTLVNSGIVINGLPIVLGFSAESDLVRYYSDCVIGGEGSFVLPVQRAYEFSTAIRRKLIREVAGREQPELIRAASRQTDCLIGEKLRERYVDPHFPGLDPYVPTPRN